MNSYGVPIRLIVVLSVSVILAVIVIPWRNRQNQNLDSPYSSARSLGNPNPTPAIESVDAPIEKNRPSSAPDSGEIVSHIDNSYLKLLLNNAAGPNRLPNDFPERVRTVTSPVEIQAVLAVVRDRFEGDTVRHEALQLLARSGYEPLTDEVLDLVQSVHEWGRFRSFLVQYLGTVLADGVQGDKRILIISRLHGLLSDKFREVKREALFALVRIRDDDAIAIVKNGLDDPAWSKDHDLIIRCLYESNDRTTIPRIRQFVNDDDESTRIAAINVLGEWRDPDSRKVFEDAEKSASLRMRRAGTLSLRLLDGESSSHYISPVFSDDAAAPTH